MLKNIKLTLLLVLTSANVLPAATYYVAKTGSDLNGGSQGLPWLTIQKAANSVVAGDTVNIGAGTYSGSVTLSCSGAAGNPTTFIGNGGVVIAGNVTFSGNYITVSGIIDSPPSAGGYNAITINGQNDILTNCTVANYGAVASDQATAIELGGASNLVVNCLVRDLNDIDAFHVFGHDHIILGCTVTNVNMVNYAENHTDFIQTWGAGGLISYNILVKNCMVVNATCDIGNTETDGSSGTHDWTFENDVFANVANPFFSGLPNTRFYNCVFYLCEGGLLNTPIAFYGIANYSSVGSEVVNCAFLKCGNSASDASQGGIGNNTVTLSTLRITQNYFAGNSYAAKSGAYIGTSAINGGDPKFVNESGYNFHLNSGSPLIGKGTNLFSVFTTDKDGYSWPSSGAWDIGAYQYATGGSSTNANPVISVSPTNLYFTSTNNLAVTNTLTVRNTAGGTLAGTASVSAPFQIVSGGTYNLTSNQSQIVTVSYNPSGVSTNGLITFTGGGGASVPVNGITTNVPSPTVSSITQNGADIDPGATGLQIFAGSVVQYLGSASDPSGLPLTWQWIYTVNGGLEIVQQSGTGVVASASFNYTSSTAGNTYVWKLRVSNGYKTSESDLTVGVEAPPAGNVIQATSGTINNPFIVTNGCIYQLTQTTTPTNGGSAYYNFTVTNAGNYIIQALVSAPNDGANSFYVNIDGEPQDPTMIWDIPITAGFEERVVSWRGNGTDTSNQFVPQIFSLGQGAHQLVIRGREANVELENFSVLLMPSPPQNLRILSSLTKLIQSGTMDGQ